MAWRVARKRGTGVSWHWPRRGADLSAVEDTRRVAEVERKIGQLTMENDFLKKALQHFKVHHPPAVVSGRDACLKKSSKALRKAKP